MKFIITANSMHWMWSFKICVFIHSFEDIIKPSIHHPSMIDWLIKKKKFKYIYMHNPFVNDTFIVSLFLCCACVREREKARNFIERKNKSFFESSSLPIIHMQNNRLARNESLTVPVAKCYVKTHNRWTTALCSSIAIEKTVNERRFLIAKI